MDQFISNDRTLACIEAGYCAVRVLEKQAIHLEWREDNAWETADQARAVIKEEFPDVQFVSRTDFQATYTKRKQAKAAPLIPFIVFIKHRDESDMHLYAFLANNEDLANQEAFDVFRTDYGPFDEDADWQAIALPLSLTPRPAWVARVDSL